MGSLLRWCWAICGRPVGIDPALPARVKAALAAVIDVFPRGGGAHLLCAAAVTAHGEVLATEGDERLLLQVLSLTPALKKSALRLCATLASGAMPSLHVQSSEGTLFSLFELCGTSAVVAYQLPRGVATAEGSTAAASTALAAGSSSAGAPAAPLGAMAYQAQAAGAPAAPLGAMTYQAQAPGAAASAWGPFGLDTALLDVAALPHLCELHAAVCALQAVLGPDPLLSMLAAPGVAAGQMDASGDLSGGVESSEMGEQVHGGVGDSMQPRADDRLQRQMTQAGAAAPEY